MTAVTIAGTGLAGVRAAEILRGEGFDGDIALIGEETAVPYDRPPLSKQILLGKSADIALLDDDQHDMLRAEWILGSPAVSFDPHTRQVRLAAGRVVPADGLIIATGSRARELPGVGHLTGVHHLRTLDDAVGLRENLSRLGRVVIIGGGFIGAEVAAAARALGNEVTIVEVEELPFQRHLGAAAARLLAGLHADHGVRLRTGVGVGALHGIGRVSEVVLSDGRTLPADVVVVGIGAAPNVEWLASSGIQCDNGVLTDEWCRTNLPRVVAVGDVASYRTRGGRLRVEHWTNARDMPVTGVKALLAALEGRDVTRLPPHDPLPYVWSDQYGSHIQIAGRPGAEDEFELVAGGAGGAFAAVYRRDGVISAALALDSPREFGRLRRELRRTWAAR